MTHITARQSSVKFLHVCNARVHGVRERKKKESANRKVVYISSRLKTLHLKPQLKSTRRFQQRNSTTKDLRIKIRDTLNTVKLELELELPLDDNK